MAVLLQLNATSNWGSTGKIAEAIGLCAERRGWKSYIAYGRYSNQSQLDVIRVGRPYDPYLHFLQSRIFDREGLGSVSATEGLIERIRRIRPDIVHLHNIHDHWLNYRILFEYLNAAGIKVVWTFHDCWAFTGHCFHFVTKSCDRWKNLCHDCPLIGEYPKSLMDNSTGNHFLKKSLFGACDDLTVVTCSQWLADIVKESFFRERRSEVIHNGIDTDVFAPLEVSRTDGMFNVLAVASVWNKEKGLDDMFRLREHLPDECRIVIAGLSPGQLRNLPQGIEGRLRTRNISQLVRLYNEADVLVNPTYADTFPTVNLEALSCGTPVVTYDTGGAPETIDSETGIVVPCGDVHAMAYAVWTSINAPFSAAACRKRVLEHFDKSFTYDKYVDLYEDIIGDSVFLS